MLNLIVCIINCLGLAQCIQSGNTVFAIANGVFAVLNGYFAYNILILKRI